MSTKHLVVTVLMIGVLTLGIIGGLKAYRMVGQLTEARAHAVDMALKGE